MSNIYFKCIKGIANRQSVIVSKGDVIKIGPYPPEEGVIHVEGVSGWCKNHELSLPPTEFVKHFETIN